MPEFAPDFADVKAGFRVLDRGEYELVIGKPKGFSYIRDNDGAHVFGVRYPVHVVAQILADGSLDDQYEGDAVSPVRLYLHNDGSVRATKQFLLAANGYDMDGEDEANAEVFADADLSFGVEGEPGDEDSEVVLGDGWSALAGRHVRVSADVGTYNDRPSQDWKVWLPIS